MRQRIEELLAEEQEARSNRNKINRDTRPRRWAEAEAEWREVRGQVSAAGREAVRSMGLAREIGRALGGTGVASRNITMDLENIAIVIELEGEPETPAQQRKAADPALTDTIQRVLDEFHSRTGIEVRFPFDKLSA